MHHQYVNILRKLIQVDYKVITLNFHIHIVEILKINILDG